MASESTCPHAGAPPSASIPMTPPPADWWPTQTRLGALDRGPDAANPLGADFNYVAAFEALDLPQVIADLKRLMTESQPWWPADFGHYGPLFVRMAWHSAGTYRIGDGRGGAGHGSQRFAPLNSWPDNVNLDKARRLLWPVKQTYGRALSWADLMVLAGTVALESMGLAVRGFGGGRIDSWEPERDVRWGPETAWLGDERHSADHHLLAPLAAVQMGLIYVNPEGPNGIPDPVASAGDIRETFARMAMNDEETVALIAGGHTFGKGHGAGDAGLLGPAPEAAGVEQQGLGWANRFGTGRGVDTIGSGLEVTWTGLPTRWSNDYLENLFAYDWELTRSPAGAQQWTPAGGGGAGTVPDAHDPSKRHAPAMLTTDLALRFDPAYERIARRYRDQPEEFAQAFADAWFKLTHRDMGPRSRYLGPWVPEHPEIWQDPVPAVDHALIDAASISETKARLLATGLSTRQLVCTAWAAAASFRGTDKRGGANGARLRLSPQRNWAANEPSDLAEVLQTLAALQQALHSDYPQGQRVSIADLIVLGGCAAIEEAASRAGHDVAVPFVPGRTDATQQDTDIASFSVLEPLADGFRNYCSVGRETLATQLLIERAAFLTLTVPQMTALIGGMRVLDTNHASTPHGVFTHRAGTLSNDYFLALLDMSTVWTRSQEDSVLYEGRERETGRLRWTATSVDLLFGSQSQLRAIAEVYASRGGGRALVDDFISAWDKVMNLDRFDLTRSKDAT